MEKAQVTLPSDQEVKVTRAFKASRALVYRTYSEPKLVQRWMLGPPGWTMPVCEMDLRVGGAYRWRWRSDDGKREFGFHGVFREIEPGKKFVHTQTFDPGNLDQQSQGGEAIVTLTFAEANGVTTVTTVIDFGSKEVRDATLATGMTDGMELSYQGLERLFAELS